MIKTLALFLAVMTLATATAVNRKTALRASSGVQSSNQSVITVLGAAFGLVDVTSKVASLIQCNTPITGSDSVLGDGWPGTVKSFTITYQIRGGNITTAVVEENESITINCFQIYGATFGLADVTSKLQSLVSSNSVTVAAEDSVFGDSWYGTVKSLAIFYSTGAGVNKSSIVAEHTTVTLS